MMVAPKPSPAPRWRPAGRRRPRPARQVAAGSSSGAPLKRDCRQIPPAAPAAGSIDAQILVPAQRQGWQAPPGVRTWFRYRVLSKPNPSALVKIELAAGNLTRAKPWTTAAE